jgi:membrane glycosyltransferase
LKPFIEHCRLPKLPGAAPLGGWILSHDQVEAVLMRRAGYEVRVLPTEEGSWEDNPPTLLEFIRRDLRWCQGNMQYLRLLTMPGLLPVSRVQLFLAIMMFVASPAWISFMTLGIIRVGVSEDAAQTFHPELGLLLFAAIMSMVFAPKIATLVDVLATAGRSRSFGGRVSVMASFCGEVLFTTLLAPVMAIAHTRFLLGLPFGHAAVWSAQNRNSHRVSFGQAFGRLWPQTAFGAAAIVWLVLTAASTLVGFLPFLLGAALAVPIAVVSSSEGLGRLLARARIWCIPDEIAPSPALQSLHLPALTRPRSALATSDPVAESASGN